MSSRYGDTCPACACSNVTPYAVIIGTSEEYGYQCQARQVSWPVLTHAETASAPSAISLLSPRAVRSA